MIAGRAIPGQATTGVAASWARPLPLLGGLAAIVWARRLAVVDGGVDVIAIGALFGLALAGLAMTGPRSLRGDAARPRLAVALGLGGGLALVGIALVARVGEIGPALLPAVAFGPWAVVTLLVAGAEELLLRGVLYGALERAGGGLVALAMTSVAFALMHVPLYGWHVVPLDLGVGVFLGGLRLAGGGWQGPAIAHAIADLATWWL